MGIIVHHDGLKEANYLEYWSAPKCSEITALIFNGIVEGTIQQV